MDAHFVVPWKRFSTPLGNRHRSSSSLIGVHTGSRVSTKCAGVLFANSFHSRKGNRLGPLAARGGTICPMNVSVEWPSPGPYILAVSGGVDSMTLLNLMALARAQRGYELVVAHFDHGIRPNSDKDSRLVESITAEHNLPFQHHAAHLGQVSEAVARTARYVWLRTVAARYNARVVTAHHQDDLIETSLLNLSRGTAHRGLAPMHSSEIVRPLLGATKASLLAYAQSRGLPWSDDETNAHLTNPRNFIRHVLMPVADDNWRREYLELVQRAASRQTEIAAVVDDLLVPAAGDRSFTFERAVIRDMELTAVAELIAGAARRLILFIELDDRRMAELALFAKTGAPHRHRPINSDLELILGRDTMTVSRTRPIS
jgi:tRNA(Ile)-lysidine synthetase-like protein